MDKKIHNLLQRIPKQNSKSFEKTILKSILKIKLIMVFENGEKVVQVKTPYIAE